MNDSTPSDSLRELYERHAELYPAPAPPPEAGLHLKFERVWGAVRDALPRERFLDAGCGDGRYLAAFARAADRPARIVGTDIAERILETARETIGEAGVDAELVRANLESLPFGDGEFDLVLCTQVIEHLLEPERGVRELARVLTSGGVLVLSTDHSRNVVTKVLNAPRTALVGLLRLRGRRTYVAFPHTSFTMSEVRGLIADTGLVITRLETFRFHLDWPLDHPRILRLLNKADRALSPHRLGDLLLVVAEKT